MNTTSSLKDGDSIVTAIPNANNAGAGPIRTENNRSRRSAVSCPRNALRLLLVTTASVAAAFSLQAQYINGQRVQIDYVSWSGVTPITNIVVDSTPGSVEVPTNPLGGSTSFDLFDIDGTQAAILIHGLKNGNFGSSLNAVRFTFPDLPSPAFKNVRLDPASNWLNLTDAALSFGTNYIQLDFAGLVNRTTYWAQINLENPALDQPELSVTVSQVQLCWTTLANRKYQVQFRTDFAGGQWTSLGNPVTAVGPKTCITEPVTATPRFYRIVTLP